MNRLRTQITLLVIVVAVIGILTAAFVTTRKFVADKRESVEIAVSTTAPSVSKAISRHLERVREQLFIFDRVLTMAQSGKNPGFGELLQTAFKNLPGVGQVDVFDANGLVASVAPAPERANANAYDADLLARLRASNRAQLIPRALLDGEAGGDWVFAFQLNERFYLARIKAETISDLLDLARPLSAQLIPDETGSEPKPFTRELAELRSNRERQTVATREIFEQGKGNSIAALVLVPTVTGAAVLVQAPAAQVRELLRGVIRVSIPFLAFILVGAVVIGLFFSARLVRPLEELTDATARIAAGAWNVKIEPRGADEISRLVGSFSKMGAELAKREELLRKANDELVRSERLAVLGKFGAGVAHEVKNPLNSILGYAQLLQRRMANVQDETAKQYLGFISDETRRASRIITDLLVFARQKSPTFAPVSIRDTVNYVCEILQPQASAASVAILKDPGEEDLRISGDRDQLIQVFLNLGSNAIQAMEEAGRPERKLIFRVRKENDAVAIEVEDNGPGISDENIGKIFEPFFTTKGVGKGTGLGLSLCLGIVEQHRGKILPRSQAGAGAVFKVVLPLGV